MGIIKPLIGGLRIRLPRLSGPSAKRGSLPMVRSAIALASGRAERNIAGKSVKLGDNQLRTMPVACCGCPASFNLSSHLPLATSVDCYVNAKATRRAFTPVGDDQA
jgi:hypothetical protein